MAAERAFARGVEFFKSRAGFRRPVGAARERPEFWIDERTCRVCYECDATFTFINRKHHCRVCGRVFCASCSSHSLPPPHNPEGEPVRVCNFCHGVRSPSLSSSARDAAAHNLALPAGGAAAADATTSTSPSVRARAGLPSITPSPRTRAPGAGAGAGAGGGDGGGGGGGGGADMGGVGDDDEWRDEVRDMSGSGGSSGRAAGVGRSSRHRLRHRHRRHRRHRVNNNVDKAVPSPVINLLGSTHGGSGGVDISSSDSESDGDSVNVDDDESEEEVSVDDDDDEEEEEENSEGEEGEDEADVGDGGVAAGVGGGGSEALRGECRGRRANSLDGGGGASVRPAQVSGGGKGGAGVVGKRAGSLDRNGATGKPSGASQAAAAVAAMAADAMKGLLVMPAAAAIAGSAGIFEPSDVIGRAGDQKAGGGGSSGVDRGKHKRQGNVERKTKKEKKQSIKGNAAGTAAEAYTGKQPETAAAAAAFRKDGKKKTDPGPASSSSSSAAVADHVPALLHQPPSTPPAAAASDHSPVDASADTTATRVQPLDEPRPYPSPIPTLAAGAQTLARAETAVSEATTSSSDAGYVSPGSKVMGPDSSPTRPPPSAALAPLLARGAAAAAAASSSSSPSSSRGVPLKRGGAAAGFAKSVGPSDRLRAGAVAVLRDDDLWRRPPPAASRAGGPCSLFSMVFSFHFSIIIFRRGRRRMRSVPSLLRGFPRRRNRRAAPATL